MKIGKYDLSIFEDGKDITNLKSHWLLSFPIVSGIYELSTFPYDLETKTDSAAIVFNQVVDLFRSVNPKDIMERFDVQISYHDGSDKLPRYYLAHIQGYPYLVSEHFGQLLIPLGNSGVSSALENSSLLERALASVLLEEGIPPEGDVNKVTYEVTDVYDAFTGFGATYEDWLPQLVAASLSKKVISEKDRYGNEKRMHKVAPFQWHPAEFVESLQNPIS